MYSFIISPTLYLPLYSSVAGERSKAIRTLFTGEGLEAGEDAEAEIEGDPPAFNIEVAGVSSNESSVTSPTSAVAISPHVEGGALTSPGPVEGTVKSRFMYCEKRTLHIKTPHIFRKDIEINL